MTEPFPFDAVEGSAPTEPVPPPALHNASPRSFARNVAFSYLATFTSLLAGVIVTPVLFRTLGTDGYGVLALVTSISGLALLADLGIGTSTIRRVAAAVGRRDDAALTEAVAASRTLMRGSALLSFAALAVVSWLLPSLFTLPHGLHDDARVALFVIGAGQAVLIFYSSSTSVLIGHGRADLYAKRSLVLGAATAAGQVTVAALGGGVVAVGAVIGASCLVSAALGVRLQRQVLGDRPPAPPPAPGRLRDVVREGGANFVISVCGAVAFTSDAIVLGALAPFTAVAAYAVAARLPTLIRTLAGKAIDLLGPTYTHLDAADDARPGALLDVLGRTTRFSLALAVAAGLAAGVSVRWILGIWLGHVPATTVSVVYLLTAATVLQMSGHALFVLLTGLRRLRALLWFSVASAATNIVLSVLLTPHLGAAGPALASLICVGLGDLVVLPRLAAPTLGVPARRVIGGLTLIPVLPAIPAVAIALLLGVPTGSASSLLVAALAVSVYVAGFWLAVGADDRRWARELVRRLRSARGQRPSASS